MKPAAPEPASPESIEGGRPRAQTADARVQTRPEPAARARQNSGGQVQRRFNLAVLLTAVVLSLAAATAGLLLALPALFGAGLGVIAALVLDILLALRPLPTFHALRVCSTTHAQHGSEASVLLRIWARGSFWTCPLWVHAHDAIPVALPARGRTGLLAPMPEVGEAIGQRGALQLTYRLLCVHRGAYRIGPDVVRAGDLLGIVETRALLPPEDEIVVYPKVVPLERFLMGARRPAGELLARQRAFEDPSRPAGTRPYMRGDALKRIHWKATAHTRRLQSKILEPSAQMEVAIIVNLNASEYPGAAGVVLSELALTAAASIASRLLETGHRVGASCPPAPARIQAGGSGPHHLQRLLEFLARAQPAVGPGLAASLMEETRLLPWTSSLLVITPDCDHSSQAALLDLRERGVPLAVLVVGETPVARHVQRSLLNAGIHTWRVSSEEDLRAAFHGEQSASGRIAPPEVRLAR